MLELLHGLAYQHSSWIAHAGNGSEWLVVCMFSYYAIVTSRAACQNPEFHQIMISGKVPDDESHIDANSDLDYTQNRIFSIL
jgi:hypothetical protein